MHNWSQRGYGSLEVSLGDSCRRTGRVICSQRLCFMEGADNAVNVEEVSIHLWPSSLSRPDGRNTCLTTTPLGTHVLSLSQSHTLLQLLAFLKSQQHGGPILWTHVYIFPCIWIKSNESYTAHSIWTIETIKPTFVTEAHANQLFSSSSAPFP